MKHIEMEDLYRQIPKAEIPWNIEEPPQVMVELVKTEKLQPCKVIDLGCGFGNYSIYLASKKFEVTGLDISPTAISIAMENSKNKGVKCNFIAADILGDLKEISETFDFAFDWELLHHIFPNQRKRYVKNVHDLLNPKGRYLSVCFSKKDPQFGGSGKFRKTPIGTKLYFSSEKEIRNLFAPYFQIDELKTIEISGKYAPHLAIYALMSKR